jgi:hypothetical protein
VRDEPSGERRRDMCTMAALTGDRGDCSAPANFVEGGTTSGARNGLKASTEGGESLGRAGVRRGGQAWKRD